MEKNFSSKALEANLAETQYKKNIIPDEHQWFLGLSETYVGIHKRAEEFILEFNHGYINYDYVINNLHNVSITDLWFYNSLKESEKALMLLADIYDNLMKRELSVHSKEQLIVTLIKFIDQLSRQDKVQVEVLNKSIIIIKQDIEKDSSLYILNSGYLKIYFARIAQVPEFKDEIFILTIDILLKSVDYWESTVGIDNWFMEKKSLFQSKYDDKLKLIGKPFFAKTREEILHAKDWPDLNGILFFNDIAEYFREFSEQFDTALEKVYYIFYLLHLPGMINLRNYLLYDMNRILKHVFKELADCEIDSFIDNLFTLFEELKHQHMDTVLDCILTIGKEIIDTKNQQFIFYYVKKLLYFGFVRPGKITINSDWQMVVDMNHLKTIRVWLELIEYSPSNLRELLSAFIVNLKLGGIFISDTDLFQRDVTKLLNSKISPVYKQIKQLARIFPVYFKEIGAEGKLREVTTSLDELSHRHDRLIHFLRKQIHTESNNTHVELSKNIMYFWYEGNLGILKQSLPLDVLYSIDTNNEWFTGVHEIALELLNKNNISPEALFEMDDNSLKNMLSCISSGSERDKNRLLYLKQLHELVLEKYSLESGNIIIFLKNYRFFSNEDISKLENCLDKNEDKEAILILFKFMHHLKKVILDDASSEALENIYYKRHVAFGIPSMYGQYMEPKFEALGLMFRIEKVASRLMEQIVQSINVKYITAKTLRNIYYILELFIEGLELDGIESQGFTSNLQMFKYGLSSPNFSFDQYINIFQFMAQNIKDIINEYFLRVYDQSLKIVIPQLHNLSFDPVDTRSKQTVQKESEIFYRDILSSAFLIQQLDNFISNIVIALQSMADSYSDAFIKKIMSYNPDLMLSPLYDSTIELDNPVFLGAKAYYLKKLTTYGFPVPPGFVLTTEMFGYKDTILKHPYISQELDQFILKHISELEGITGLKFGSISNPLLFSVRSGTAISMPGAMSTFLNVGMNDDIVEGLSRNPKLSWTAWDCYRRFIQSWGMAYGIDRDIFDSVIIDYKSKHAVEQKIYFTPEQMKNIAYSYKMVLSDYNIRIESNPFLQLKQAIINVIESWSSPRAKSFRKHLQIANEWGTAVIVQKMVLGNISNKSGTGVVFTHNPKQNNPGVNLYGDFTLRSQGEDIVSGLVHTLPVTEYQRKEFYNDCDISLELSFPGIYRRLLELSNQLIETYGFTHQEIEFTFESDSPEDLFILQTRDQKISKKGRTPVFSLPPEQMKLIGRGIGIGGGAISGIIVFNMEDLQNYIKIYPERKHIVVRPDTVPDDIPMTFICDGLITSRGGATSHAAVTAASLGKVCIVNCRDLYVNEQKKECTIGGIIFKSGDTISIDGNLGTIYAGSYPVEYIII